MVAPVVDVFEALARLSKEHGDRVEVRRFVLPSDLRRVRGDDAHRARLAEWRAKGLFPVTLVDGQVVKTGVHPTYGEMLAFLGAADGS